MTWNVFDMSCYIFLLKVHDTGIVSFKNISLFRFLKYDGSHQPSTVYVMVYNKQTLEKTCQINNVSMTEVLCITRIGLYQTQQAIVSFYHIEH